MTDKQKEVYVSRVISGVVYVESLGKKYLIQKPSLLNTHLASLHYLKKYGEAKRCGVMTEEEITDVLLKEKLWTHEDEYRLEEIPDRIEDAKVNLYKAYANYKSRQNARTRLKALKEEYTKLIKKKGIWRQESAEAFAESSQMKFEVFAGITDMDGKNLFKGDDYLEQSDYFCNLLVSHFLGSHLYEEEIREICRTEPWRGFWNTGKSVGSMFSQPSIELTQSQRAVISWSRIYDSIYDSPDSPQEEILKDDDMLDGWLILQHRKRKAQQKSSTAENQANVKGDEVYLFADDNQDAQRIYELNDRAARGQIRQRQKEIESAEKRGESLPVERTTEAKLEMRRISTEQFKSSVR